LEILSNTARKLHVSKSTVLDMKASKHGDDFQTWKTALVQNVCKRRHVDESASWDSHERELRTTVYEQIHKWTKNTDERQSRQKSGYHAGKERSESDGGYIRHVKKV
jgi:hypothetical protein